MLLGEDGSVQLAGMMMVIVILEYFSEVLVTLNYVYTQAFAF